MWQITWQCYIYSSQSMVTVEFGFHLTSGWPHLTSCFIQKWPKINSIRQYTKRPKLEFFWIFQKLKFRTKMCLNRILEHQKNFHPFLRDIGRDDFFQIFGFFEILEFWKKFQNNRNHFWSFEFLDHLLLRQLFKNFIFFDPRMFNELLWCLQDLKENKCQIWMTV